MRRNIDHQNVLKFYGCFLNDQYKLCTNVSEITAFFEFECVQLNLEKIIEHHRDNLAKI